MPAKVQPADDAEPAMEDSYGTSGALRVKAKLREVEREEQAETADAQREGAEVVQGKMYDPANDPSVAPLVIDPRSKRMQQWDVIIGVLLVYTAIVTPYEVGFLETYIGVLFVINRLVDLCFLADIGVNFFMAYYDSHTRMWVCQHKKIAYRYLTGWFFLDVASILPFDSITVFLEESGKAADAASFKKLKVFRAIRLLRLLKLIRLVRGARILQRWENSMSIRFSVLALIKFVLATLLISHWIACALRLTVDIELVGGEGAGHVSWMSEYSLRPGCEEKACPLSSASPGDQYVAAMYWSVMTLTTIGYGDVVAKTHGERVLVIVCMIIGAGMYAYIVGAVCGIVASMDEVTTQYHQRMDNLNSFMEESSLPHELRVRLRGFFQHTRSLLRHDYYKQLILAMSPELRGNVTVYLNASWIQKVPFFNTPDTTETSQFICEVSVRLEPCVYGKEEWVVQVGSRATMMYLVQKGIAARSGGRIFTSGRYFGEEMVCTNARRDYEVKALTVLDLLSFSKASLDDILENGEYPLTRRRVRKAVIRMAFLNNFVAHPKLLADSYEGAQQRPAASKGRSDNTVQDAVAYLKDMQQRAQEVSSFLLGEGTLDPGMLAGGAGAGGGGASAGGGAAGGAVVAASSAGAAADGGGTRRRSLVGIVPDSGGAMVTIGDAGSGGVAGGVNVEIPNLDEKLVKLSHGTRKQINERAETTDLKMGEITSAIVARLELMDRKHALTTKDLEVALKLQNFGLIVLVVINLALAIVILGKQ